MDNTHAIAIILVAVITMNIHAEIVDPPNPPPDWHFGWFCVSTTASGSTSCGTGSEGQCTGGACEWTTTSYWCLGPIATPEDVPGCFLTPCPPTIFTDYAYCVNDGVGCYCGL